MKNPSKPRIGDLRQQLFYAYGALLDQALLWSPEGEGYRVELDEDSEDLPLARYNALYWQGCANHVTEKPLMVSAAPDKSRIHTMGVMMSPVVVGEKVAWACPQDSNYPNREILFETMTRITRPWGL